MAVEMAVMERSMMVFKMVMKWPAIAVKAMMMNEMVIETTMMTGHDENASGDGDGDNDFDGSGDGDGEGPASSSGASFFAS